MYGLKLSINGVFFLNVLGLLPIPINPNSTNGQSILFSGDLSALFVFEKYVFTMQLKSSVKERIFFETSSSSSFSFFIHFEISKTKSFTSNSV